MKMKRMEMQETVVGDYTFRIRPLSHLEGVGERYRESDQRQLAELNTRNK